VSRSTRVLAVAASAVLGLVGGAVGATVFDHKPAGPDPLALGISLVNQQCTGESLLVTSTGLSPTLLSSAVAEDPDHTRYLQIDRSCPTTWRESGAPARGYATYLGPYSSPGEACRIRMTAAHRGDPVARLVNGSSQPVQCLCYLDFATMPQLRPGMEVGALDGIYVFALQRLLTTMGLNPPDHDNGLYDELTQTQIKAFQRSIPLPQNGVVDHSIWHSLLQRGCRDYTA
jgi:hypothetical protein